MIFTDPESLRVALNRSFGKVIEDVVSSELKFATDVSSVASSVPLFTLGQCVPDLSKEDCVECLDSAVQLLEYKQNGSRFLYPSCNSRFEFYPFFRMDDQFGPVQPPIPVSGDTLAGKLKELH